MKIKNKNLDKILHNATSKEIDFMLYVIQFQDEYGTIKGINYIDVCQSINITPTTFYDVLKGLETKDIITVDYNNTDYSFFTVTINENDFSSASNYKDGYLNVNYNLLHSTDFQQLTRGEKVIILNLYKISNSRYEIKATIDTLCRWTSYKKQAVVRYLKRLSKMLTLKRENNTITFIANNYFYEKGSTEKNILNTHLVKYLTKKNRASTDDENIKDVVNLFNQYSYVVPDVIYDIIDKSLKTLKILQVKYIHKYLSNYLEYTDLKR